MGYAQATTNGAGLRLFAGMDLSGMKIQSCGKRIDVWNLQSDAYYIKKENPVLGDLLHIKKNSGGIFGQLAQFAVEQGHDLRSPVLMRKGASHQRLQVGKKLYLRQTYRFYQRAVAGEN